LITKTESTRTANILYFITNLVKRKLKQTT